MSVQSKILTCLIGMASAAHLISVDRRSVSRAKSFLGIAQDEQRERLVSKTFGQAIIAGGKKTQGRKKSAADTIRSLDMPPEQVEALRNATGLSTPGEGKTHEDAWLECEAAWKTCALVTCPSEEDCPALATRVVAKEDALTKCPHIKALADAEVLHPDDLPEHLSGEQYKEGCMCINSVDGCPPPPYPGPEEVCESAWGACSAMETNSSLREQAAISKQTATTLCPGVMQGIETGLIIREEMPKTVPKADYMAGCTAFLAMPPPDHTQPEFAGMAPANHTSNDHVNMVASPGPSHPAVEGFPMPDENCWSSWDMCMATMHRVHDFALYPAETLGSVPAQDPAVTAPVTTTGSVALLEGIEKKTQLLQKLAKSKLHRYAKSVLYRSGAAAHGSTAGPPGVVDAAEPAPPATYDPRVPFADLAEKDKDPMCHGVLHMLHEKARKMTVTELERVPAGVTGSEFVEHVCLPALHAHEPFADPTYDSESPAEHECEICLTGCGEGLHAQHESIDETVACTTCHHCHHGSAMGLYNNGCEGMMDKLMGSTNVECHMQCDATSDCEQCHSAHMAVHEGAHKQYDKCTTTCHETTCAGDGTFDHDQHLYEPQDMDDCVNCHRSCSGDAECTMTCDDICGIVKHQEMMANSHHPLSVGGVVAPPVGDERTEAEMDHMGPYAAEAVVPAPAF